MMRATACIVAAALALALNGCLEFVQVITLNADGSGEMRLHYWTRASVAPHLTAHRFSFDRRQAERNFAGAGTTLDSLAITSDDADSTVHARIVLRFTELSRLQNCPVFKGFEYRWETRDGSASLMEKIPAMPEAGNPGMERASVVVRYVLPGAPRESNATESNGAALTWRYTLPEIAKGATLTATMPGAAYPWYWALFVLCGTGGYLWWRKRRKLKISAPSTTRTPRHYCF